MLALAGLMARPDVTALISGPSRTAPHLSLAAQAGRVELDDELADRLTELFRTSSTG
jgi:aryl-alcohol dehydrogenase-like predicted oxidoreductase